MSRDVQVKFLADSSRKTTTSGGSSKNNTRLLGRCRATGNRTVLALCTLNEFSTNKSEQRLFVNRVAYTRDTFGRSVCGVSAVFPPFCFCLFLSTFERFYHTAAHGARDVNRIKPGTKSIRPFAYETNKRNVSMIK